MLLCINLVTIVTRKGELEQWSATCGSHLLFPRWPKLSIFNLLPFQFNAERIMILFCYRSLH